MSNHSTSRRNFLIAGAVVGTGLYVGIRFADRKFGEAAATGESLQPNAFVRVAPDDTVTVIIGKSEMGQGVYTGLAMVVAEELDVDPNRVRVEMAGADPAFNAPFMPMQFTGDADKDFATSMMKHHAGGIEMAKIQLKHGKDPEMRKMAEKLIKEQGDDNKEFATWLKKNENK